MVPHHTFAPEYLAATVRIQLTHQPIFVNWQLVDRLDDLAGHLQLVSVLNQTGSAADLVCYQLGLLAFRLMAALHMALDLAGQNAVPALFAHC
jgi:hypothetical protein